MEKNIEEWLYNHVKILEDNSWKHIIPKFKNLVEIDSDIINFNGFYKFKIYGNIPYKIGKVTSIIIQNADNLKNSPNDVVGLSLLNCKSFKYLPEKIRTLLLNGCDKLNDVSELRYIFDSEIKEIVYMDENSPALSFVSNNLNPLDEDKPKLWKELKKLSL